MLRRGEHRHWFRNLQVIALRAAASGRPEFISKLEPDGDYFIRKVFRWYSKEFSTPLHEVLELPLDDVLTHYWESQYEQMDDDEIVAAIKRLRETEEERKAREAKEQDAVGADEAWLRQVEQEEQQRIANKAAPAPAAPRPAHQRAEKESQLPDYVDKPLEGFKVNFVNDPREIEELMKKWDEG
jgi:hypothetical protein